MLTQVYKNFTGSHYPNLRLKGLMITPTVIGLLVFLILRWTIFYHPFPIVVLGFIIYLPTIIVLYFETLLLVWGLVSVLLLILWIGGDSYRHLYLGAPAFGFFCAYLLQSGSLFLLLTLIVAISCFIISIYTLTQTQHLSKDLVNTLLVTKQIKGPALILTFRSYVRTVEYYGEKHSTFVGFERTPVEALTHPLK